MAYEASVLIRNSSRQAVAWLENCIAPGYSFRMNEVYTAHFSLPADDAKASYVTMRALFELYENDGTSKGLFRIVRIDRQHNAEGTLIACQGEHVISTLLDDMILGEYAINVSGATPTTQTAIEYVLSQQTTANWAFGTEGFSKVCWYKWKDQSLLSALLDIPARFGADYLWTYNLAAYPWTVSLTVPSATVSGYIAYSRNLKGITKRESTSEFYNRLYPYGAGEYPNQLTIAAENSGLEYLEDATSVSTYGRVTRVWNDQRFTDDADLKTAAQKLLADSKDPVLYYDMDVADLSQLTGIDVAALEVGSLVKVYDDDLGVDVDARVVAIAKDDMLSDPGGCRVELANKFPEFDLGTDYGSPGTEETIGTSGNIVPNYSFERLDGNIPRWWTCSGWEQTTEYAFNGVRSLKGTGTGSTAYCDKAKLANATTGLLLQGHARSSAVTPNPIEVTNVATTSAPTAYCDASGTTLAIIRQDSSYDIIELWSVADASNPYKVGTISAASSHRSWPFAFYDKYLICGNSGAQYLYIYDISNPASPSLVTTYTLQNSTARLDAVAVRDWHIYAICLDWTNGPFLEVINMESPASAYQTDLIEQLVTKKIGAGHVVYAVAHNDTLIFPVRDTGIAWRLPTAHSDPSFHWTSEANAYDDDVGTYATASGTGWIVFTVGAHWSTQIRFKCSGSPDAMDVDVSADGVTWTDVYSGYAGTGLQTKTFPGQFVTQARFRFTSLSGTGELYEFNFWADSEWVGLYDISDPTSVALLSRYHQDGLKKPVLNGDYLYMTCDDDTDANKIVVLDISDPTSVSRVTAVGGAGATNYTGADALFMSNGYLVNVGAGTDASHYSVGYWDVSTPAAPTLEAVTASLSGDLDAACTAGGVIYGVDVDNSKVRVVTGEGTDWKMDMRFYDVNGTLVGSIEVYDGDKDPPITTQTWCRFDKRIPRQDIPEGATQLDVLLTSNTGTDSVYVDALTVTCDVD
ncbi:MAG: phage tail protein [Actinomycetia bacterium]|nr:phage tail protein [Actinomycetes bacterium]